MTAGPDLRLGLIGDNIARSRAPVLHHLAGVQNGLAVQYDRLIPQQMNADFDAVFDSCAARGYRGINVTYPYKERAARKVAIEDARVRAIGAVNKHVARPFAFHDGAAFHVGQDGVHQAGNERTLAVVEVEVG